MPNGGMPTYEYRPDDKQTTRVSTRSSRRSRLWAGGTYFRATDPGWQGNNVTAEVLVEDTIYYAVFTNKNVDKDLPYRLERNDLSSRQIIIIQNSTASLYTISVKKMFELQSSSDDQVKSYFAGADATNTAPLKNSLFGLVIGQLVDGLVIRPRIKIFEMLPPAPPPQETSSSSGAGSTDPTTTGTQGGGPDPAILKLRLDVNAANFWVEMRERSTTSSLGGSSGGAVTQIITPPNGDVQDKETDAVTFTVFPETNFANGDGLPANPDTEKTGPSRSLVHINYGEQKNGSLTEHNTIYEWVGSTNTIGVWKAY